MEKRKIGLILGTYAYWCFLIFGFFYFVTLGSKLLFYNNALTSIFCFGCVQLLKRDKIKFNTYSHLLVACTFTALVVINLTLSGLNSPMQYWFLAIILGAGFMLETKWMVLWGFKVSAFYLFCYYLGMNSITFDFQILLKGDMYSIYHLSSLIGVVTLIILFAWSYINLTYQYNKELKKSYDRNNFLLKILNHDLANPITVLELGIRKINANNCDEVKEKLLKSNKSMIDIINSVRSIDKFHISEINFETENLKSCVEEVIPEVQLIFAEKNLTYEIEVPANIQVNISKSIFTNQILKNLLTNASKFSEPNASIYIRYQDSTLIISDSGIGIPKAMISDLFDYRSNNSRKGTMGEKGTGFGLPIVKDCCDKMNIEITVASDDDGTDFNLTFQDAA
jgi:signal transduction histidine kinase